MWYGLKIGNFRRLAAVSVTIGHLVPGCLGKKVDGWIFCRAKVIGILSGELTKENNCILQVAYHGGRKNFFSDPTIIWMDGF